MIDDFPSLTGMERARHEDWNVACWLYGWAIHKLRKAEADIVRSPNNKRLRYAVDDIASAVSEKLDEWQPTHRAN
jgi:hypothetical protein